MRQFWVLFIFSISASILSASQVYSKDLANIWTALLSYEALYVYYTDHFLHFSF